MLRISIEGELVLGIAYEVGEEATIIQIFSLHYHKMEWGLGKFNYEYTYRFGLLDHVTYFTMMLISRYVLPNAFRMLFSFLFMPYSMIHVG